ncbi:MAG: phosphoglycerate kinase [bacterium]|nr:phosphoglycerate kinase [bacterium]
MNKVTVADINFRGRKVLLRVDFNVPLDERRHIRADHRIQTALPTIRKILADGGMVIACSHLGRPKGKHVPDLSLRPVADRLSELLGQTVTFAEDCIGPEAANLIGRMQNGDCLLLENLRFHQGETENDPEFARKLSELGDIYVNDAFGTAHREHASTSGATKYFGQAVAGFLMEKELRYLAQIMGRPARPFAAILGGAKISGKIGVVSLLMDQVDTLVISGAMAFTFARAMGHSTGDSLVEEDRVELAREILARAGNSKVNLVFPTDIVATKDIAVDASSRVVPFDAIPDGFKGVDIGPDSVRHFGEALKGFRTVIWNGPMGVCEIPQFASGTVEIARLMGRLTDTGATTVVGGGDSAAAVDRAGLHDVMTHVSTGGGATLKFLEGKSLPGVAALTDQVTVGTV